MESENRSRAFHNLPEVFGERSKRSLLFCSRAGGRPRTLAKARADSGTPQWNFHSRSQMGTTEPKHRCPRHGVNHPRDWRKCDRLEPRIGSANAEECRSASI